MAIDQTNRTETIAHIAAEAARVVVQAMAMASTDPTKRHRMWNLM